jgi:hypothetical protein
LESAWENLNPELIENISTDPNIANEHTVRPSGFSGDLSQLSGTPRSDFVAGGFMPAPELTPKEAARQRIAARMTR